MPPRSRASRDRIVHPNGPAALHSYAAAENRPSEPPGPKSDCRSPRHVGLNGRVIGPRWGQLAWPLLATALILLAESQQTLAQTRPAQTRPSQSQPAPSRLEGVQDDLVELNLAGPTSLPKLVEAVSRQLNLRFLYSADMANRQVTVYTPAKLPRSALPVLLGSLLKGENLAIVPSDVPGWKRIVDVADMAPYATTGEAEAVLARDGPAAAVTQVIPLQNADATRMSQTLRPFLSKGAEFVAMPENGLVIVTDFAQNVRTIVELLKLIDRPAGQSVVNFYDTINRTPAVLIEQAEALIAPGGGDTGMLGVRLFNDASGKRVVVAGDSVRVDQALKLLKTLDTGTDFVTRVYRLQNVGADRMDHLIRGLVRNEEADTAIETTIDEEGNLLIVRAASEVHRQIETLLRELDRPVDSDESPIRFYKLKNANAVEVLYSLLALQEAAGSGQVLQVGGFGAGAFGTLGLGGVTPAMGIGGALYPRAGMGGLNAPLQTTRLPLEDGSRRELLPTTNNMNQNEALAPIIAAESGMGGLGMAGTGMIGPGLGATGLGAGMMGSGQVATLPGGARVSADVATNSLIVYAPTSVQPLYERLIRSLDQRRPQVMIEAEIVAVDTSDNFSLGVEVSIGDRTGANRLFKFTSFGLSEVDPSNGFLTVDPSLGFNGVLIDPDVADVIVQALSTHNRSRVLASPKILVNDNQTGTLESVASIPFQSVNASQTVSTTSLGGNQQAGTIITVTPHINEDDHLQLEFDVEFSTFVGQGGANLPPPRQIDRVGSVVTIPDGKTVVVGGLKRIGEMDSFTGVPWAEKIPIIRELTSLTTADDATTSFFLFIRPKILRDSRFRDLRYLSEIDIQDAQIAGDDPVSGPILIPCPKPPTPIVRQSPPRSPRAGTPPGMPQH